MVQMIPAEPRSGANKSEKALFQAFKEIQGKPDWVVIHSLVMGQNVFNLSGEADFVVLVPGRGIITIEAKAPSAVEYRDGEWNLVGTPSPNKNPFKQLDQSRGNVRAFLKRHEIFADAPMPRLLWLTSIANRNSNGNQIAQGMEFFDWELAWSDDLKNPAKVIEDLLFAYERWYAENQLIQTSPEDFTQAELETIIGHLLPTINVEQSPADRHVQRALERRDALAEQVAQLELVEGNSHLYFEGAAGTGKSFLLQELARDFAKSGRKTLVACWNIMLAEETAATLGARPNLVVADVNKLMLQVCGLKENPEGADNEWYTKTLPAKAVAALEAKPGLRDYMAICFDEFQDIASNTMLVDFVLSLAKPGDLTKVKLAFAGDSNQQIMIEGGKWVDPFDRLKAIVPDLVNVRLKTNCRSAPKLAEHFGAILHAPLDIQRHRLPPETEGGLQLIPYRKNEQAKVLDSVLKDLLTRFPKEDIRILSPFSKTSLLGEMVSRQANSEAERSLKGLIRYMTRPGVRWRSIAKFKGLESDVVVITDIDQRAVDFYKKNQQTLGQGLYVGATRARNWCIILVGDDVVNLSTNRQNEIVRLS